MKLLWITDHPWGPSVRSSDSRLNAWKRGRLVWWLIKSEKRESPNSPLFNIYINIYIYISISIYVHIYRDIYTHVYIHGALSPERRHYVNCDRVSWCDRVNRQYFFFCPYFSFSPHSFFFFPTDLPTQMRNKPIRYIRVSTFPVWYRFDLP